RQVAQREHTRWRVSEFQQRRRIPRLTRQDGGDAAMSRVDEHLTRAPQRGIMSSESGSIIESPLGGPELRSEILIRAGPHAGKQRERERLAPGLFLRAERRWPLRWTRSGGATTVHPTMLRAGRRGRVGRPS